MAHVRKITRTGRWQARWTGADDKPHARNFPRKGDADAFLKTVGDIGGSPTMTVTDLALAHHNHFHALVRAGAREQVTLDGYGTALDIHLASDPAFARTRLCDLTTPRTQAFLDGLFGRGASLDVCKRMRTTLVSWCKFGARKGWLVANPAEACEIDKTSRPEADKEPVEIPAKATLAALLTAAGEGPEPERDAAVVNLLLFAGPRISELLGLADDAVPITPSGAEVRVRERLDRHYKVLGKPKSKAGRRDIPVGPRTALTVKAWRMKRGVSPAHGDMRGRLFPGAAGGPGVWSYNEFLRDCWNPLLKRTGLFESYIDQWRKPRLRQAFGPHALRHAYASIQIENGVTPKRLQQLMGHATIKVTMDTYGHLWRDDKADAAMARAAEALIGKNP